ncbi:autophagy-related protein 13 [Ceratobasidium sp. AG-Ba]|nr:autophagy-related protein 13 [Ceratobasidium sp. AG-Ba]
MEDSVEQIILRWYIKAAMLIADARVTQAPSTLDRSTNRWFELETPDNSRFQDLEEDIAGELANSRSFQLRVRVLLAPCSSGLVVRRSAWFYDRATPLGKVVVNVPQNIRSILLEEWVVTFDPTAQRVSKDQNREQHYQRGATLIQSLYSFLRTMPAWILHDRMSSDETMQIVVEASLSVATVGMDVLKLDQKVASSDPDAITFEFPPLVNPIGMITAQVRYRACTSFRLVPVADPGSSWVALTKGEGALFKQAAPLTGPSAKRNIPPPRSNGGLVQSLSAKSHYDASSGDPRSSTSSAPEIPLPIVRANGKDPIWERPARRGSSFFKMARSIFRRRSTSSSESSFGRSGAQSPAISDAHEGSSVTSNRTSIYENFDECADTTVTTTVNAAPSHGTSIGEGNIDTLSQSGHIKHRASLGRAVTGDLASGVENIGSNLIRTISSTMSISEIVAVLDNQNCPDISQKLDLLQCDNSAISGGGFGDIYRGRLQNGELVVIKCPRLFFDKEEQRGDVLKASAE